MKEKNSFNSTDSKSSIEDILNDMSQKKNLFQIKQLESKILTEKAFLENFRVQTELKQKDGIRKPENCNKCNKNKKLKFCQFCGFYYCEKCFAKKRKNPIPPNQFLPCCVQCEDAYIRIFLFESFDEQREKLQKEISINEQIKQEMINIYDKQNNDLQESKVKYEAECQQLSDFQQQIQIQEQTLRKKIQQNEEEQRNKTQSVQQEQAQILQLEEKLKIMQQKYENQQKLSQDILLQNLNDETEKIKLSIKDLIEKIYTNKDIESNVNINIRQRTLSENQKKKIFFQSQVQVQKNFFEEKPQPCKCEIF